MSVHTYVCMCVQKDAHAYIKLYIKRVTLTYKYIYIYIYIYTMSYKSMCMYE